MLLLREALLGCYRLLAQHSAHAARRRATGRRVSIPAPLAVVILAVVILVRRRLRPFSHKGLTQLLLLGVVGEILGRALPTLVVVFVFFLVITHKGGGALLEKLLLQSDGPPLRSRCHLAALVVLIVLLITASVLSLLKKDLLLLVNFGLTIADLIDCLEDLHIKRGCQQLGILILTALVVIIVAMELTQAGKLLLLLALLEARRIIFVHLELLITQLLVDLITALVVVKQGAAHFSGDVPRCTCPQMPTLFPFGTVEAQE